MGMGCYIEESELVGLNQQFAGVAQVALIVLLNALQHPGGGYQLNQGVGLGGVRSEYVLDLVAGILALWSFDTFGLVLR